MPNSDPELPLALQMVMPSVAARWNIVSNAAISPADAPRSWTSSGKPRLLNRGHGRLTASLMACEKAT